MGDIALEIKNENSILDAWVSAWNKENDSFDINTELCVCRDFEISCEIYLNGSVVKTVSSNSSVVCVKRDEMSLWSPQNPVLYTAKLSLIKNGEICDTYTLTFGIRRLETDGNKLFFNSSPIFLRGICEHGYFLR